MLDVYTEILNIIDQLIEKPLEFLRAIEDLYILEFVENNGVLSASVHSAKKNLA
ncbi:hypothetical protein BuS5_03891 [Desulfosarcina sp. BuS5]|nr:hypothetical protein BuS5_03891 [Desulfosarcina sp. BuS5]